MRGAIIFAVLLLTACGPAPQPPVAVAPPARALAGDPVEGLRVAARVGCIDCHGRDGSGAKLWGEEGKFQLYSANLTVKRELYDDAGIDGLLRHGRTHDGHRPLGMPIFMVQHLSDREIRDITAWLRAIPVVARPDQPVSWFSEEGRRLLEEYKGDDPDPAFRPLPEPPSEPLALGRHLAMTTCSECHGRDLNGAPEDGVPPLLVAKAYSADDFMRLMRTGIVASGTESASGLMTAVGKQRASSMTDDEVRALKAYLDSR
jgi:mono/diheme cytochrome c family protein